MRQTAKLFTNGRSQAVRLPAAFRFDGKEVFIRKDGATGDVILSGKPEKPKDWNGFFEAMKGVNVPEDFLSPENRNQGEHRRDPLESSED